MIPTALMTAAPSERSDDCSEKERARVDEKDGAAEAVAEVESDPVEDERGWKADESGVDEGGKEFGEDLCVGVLDDEDEDRDDDCDEGDKPESLCRRL